MPKSDNSDDFSLQEGGWMDLRKKIWDQLEEKKQLLSRRPPYKLIPNFKGSDVVINQLMELEFMKSANVIVCDPDRVLADIRLFVLQEGKTLMVPSPRLKAGILRHVVPAKDASASELRDCARANASNMGVTIEFDQKLHIDVVILSSIAASTSGRRIGRADLFAELELVLLGSLGLVDDQTVVITVVHDLQIVTLDDTGFGPHDAAVDYIVTPTQVIKCDANERPARILWSAMSREALDVLPVLKFFRRQDASDGKDVCLAGETNAYSEMTLMDCVGDGAVSPRKVRSAKGKSKRKKKNVQSRSEDQLTSRENSKAEAMEEGKKGKSASENDAVGRPSYARRNNRVRKPALGVSCSDEHLKEDRGLESDGRGTKLRKAQSALPALYIGGLVRNLRTWELRRLVKDHAVSPLFIVRPPFVGYAFLHFKTMDEVRSALESLSRLRVSDEGIRVEIARRSASLFGSRHEEDSAELSQ